jgi:hypothetical protein
MDRGKKAITPQYLAHLHDQELDDNGCTARRQLEVATCNYPMGNAESRNRAAVGVGGAAAASGGEGRERQ